MNEIKKIIYNCREATYLIEKKQLSKITFKEKIKLRIHLFGCSICRVFEQQSTMINKMVKNFLQTSPHADAKLDEGFKKELQEQIEEKLKKD